MRSPEAKSGRLHFHWTSEYHGPNPFASSEVLVGDLSGDVYADEGQIEVASTTLWSCSGMSASEGTPIPKAPGDALLAMGWVATCWTQAALNEVRGFVLHAGAARAGNVVRLWVGFHHPTVSRAALQLALRALLSLLDGRFDRIAFGADLARLWESCRRFHPDYQARILMQGAREMEVPYLPFLPGSRYWQFGWGRCARVFFESSSNEDGVLGAQWQRNKATAKALMKALGLPTPPHQLISNADEVSLAVRRVGFPCAVKPVDSGGGKGVTANVRSMRDARTAFEIAHRKKRGSVMVEAHVPGDDHRLMVIRGQLVAVIRRVPSFVIGDGLRTISSLLAVLNLSRSGNMVRSRYLRRIAMDDVLERHLAAQGLSLSDIPPEGVRVSLRSNANLSTGGLCMDVTALCHPAVRAMAEHLARASGLATIGIDYLTTDIAGAPADTGGAFIEMNTTPGLDACIAAGWPEARIARMVLGPLVAAVPVDLTILSAQGFGAMEYVIDRPSIPAGRAIIIGERLLLGELVLHVDQTEPWATFRASLRHRGVQEVHLICAAEDVCHYGLPVDRFRSVVLSTVADGAVLPDLWSKAIKAVPHDTFEHVPEQVLVSTLQCLMVQTPSAEAST